MQMPLAIAIGHLQTWNNAQACNQCFCKVSVFGEQFSNVTAFYIENAQKGLCKAKFDCVNYMQYSMSGHLIIAA